MEFLSGFCAGIFGKIGEFTVEPVGRQLGYLIYYKSNMESIEMQTQHLKDAKKRMEHCIDEARRKGEEIEDDVQTWVGRVNTISEEVETFLRDAGQANTRCSNGPFPNLVLRHRISRKAKKMAKTVGEIKEDGKFDKISYIPIRQTIFEIKGYIAFKTRNSIVMGIMEALGDGNLTLIGVSGMAGVGKTTIVKEIARRALEEKLFSDAVEVTVSQTPNHKNIQQEIAEKLGLRLRVNSIRERADKLRYRLRQEKNFLIILDDVWKKLDLLDIGISFDDDQKECKMLLTSRSQDVLCNDMDVQKNFPIEFISKDEAWIWFTRIVGDSIKNSEIQSLATQIVKKCAGLPVAITTVAHALRNKSLSVWKDALRQLQRLSSINIKGSMNEMVYSSIKLSYDFLEIEEAKLLFLLCSLHEEDATIMLENLLKYAMGLDLFHGISTLEEARNHLHTLVDKLKAHSLLLDGDGTTYVKMHDVIRDVGISIASGDNHMYTFGNCDDLSECLSKKKLKESTAVFLHYVSDDYLPTGLECNQLRLLRMNIGQSLEISDTFYEKTDELRVLDLSHSHAKVLLPSSFCFLQNLRMLCLHKCETEDVTLIGKLHNLETLDLSESKIVELPKEIRELTQLRLLDLNNCYYLKVIQPSVISSLTRLEELYINTFWAWEVDVLHDNAERSNACLTELKNLARLTALHFSVNDTSILPKGIFGENLNRYNISIGRTIYQDMYKSSRVLKLVFIESILLNQNDLKALLKKSEVLHLDQLFDADNFFCELAREGFPQLKHFYIGRSPDIRYIVDSRGQFFPHNAFSTLESLHLKYLGSLEKICRGKLSIESFGKLKVLEVTDCVKLKNLFSFSIARNLLQLEEIKVSRCTVMEEIVTHEREDDADTTNKIEFPQLCTLTLNYMPKLTQFFSELKKTCKSTKKEEIILIADSSISFFNGKIISFPKLSTFKLLSLSSSGLEISNTHLLANSTSFQNLVTMTVVDCGFLKNLLSSSVVASLVQLQQLHIQNCKRMEEIIIISTDENVDKMSFPKLDHLWLNDLPNLTRFSTYMFIEFPLLTALTIQSCPKLETFVSNFRSTNVEVNKETGVINMEEKSCTTTLSLFTEKVAFPSLKKMELVGMDNLEMIWDQYGLNIDSCYKLEDIRVENSKNLLKMFPSNMLSRILSIQRLHIEACEKIEMVFEIENGCTKSSSAEQIRCSLWKMDLVNLPCLRHVWSRDPKGTLNFPNLQTLAILECPRLESIFPLSIAKDLAQLEYLKIKRCGIHEIVPKVEELETMPMFVFHQLIDLELSYLHELVSFYPGLHASKWPVLKSLKVNNCNSVKVFASEILLFKETCELVHQHTIEQPLFLTEKNSFPILESLYIEFMVNWKIIWKDQQTAWCFRKLDKITVVDCPNLISIFPCNNSIRGMFDVDFAFENLTEIACYGCGGLKNIFPPYLVEALVQLKKMKIWDCGIQEIVGEDEISDHHTLPKFVFPQLAHLELKDLSQLEIFHCGPHTSEWPLLEHLEVSGCINIRVVASDFTSFQETSGLANPDAPIYQPLFLMDKVKFSKLKTLELKFMDNMKMIWRGQLLADSFCELQKISVLNCKNLTKEFPSNISDEFKIQKLGSYSYSLTPFSKSQ